VNNLLTALGLLGQHDAARPYPTETKLDDKSALPIDKATKLAQPAAAMKVDFDNLCGDAVNYLFYMHFYAFIREVSAPIALLAR
jgi:hypothetical protein